ncbi:hypothetical protein PGT21_022672 [Puccinia graminis f. sp. tritici]|uniref:Uncharacterized protein n=1 Tax=Puccinia graminis f. sp. tritici TaxID=56615 RepID=A0A5B0PAT0_PUCGR|nr:hypothetical protein PGT21_022672 [Puccinia graminis f. sp. tritici]
MTSQIKSGKHLSSRSKKSPVDEAGLTLQVVNEANLTLVGGRKSLPWLRHQPNLSSIQNRPPAKGETLVNEEDECTFTRKYMSKTGIKAGVSFMSPDMDCPQIFHGASSIVVSPLVLLGDNLPGPVIAQSNPTATVRTKKTFYPTVLERPGTCSSPQLFFPLSPLLNLLLDLLDSSLRDCSLPRL